MTTTVGVDLGGTKAFAVRLEGTEIVAEARVATSSGEIPEVVVAAARQVMTDDVEAIGAGVAGLVRWPEGQFVWGPNVPGEGIPVREKVAAELGLPTVVDNDANMAAWGELHLGAARGYRHVLMVTLGTGIGGAIVADGRLYRGTSFAGELGHIVYDPGGTLCGCGKRGCWETMASGPALARLARDYLSANPHSQLARLLDGVPLTGEAVTQAADAGDETARGLVGQVGGHLGRGLSNLIAVLDPEVMIIGGGLGSVGESLLGPARRVVADAMHGGSHRLAVPILVAGLGPQAGAAGAALLAAALVAGEVEAL